jgi:hypothetical protein
MPRLIGRFESVDEAVRLGVSPFAFTASAASRTSALPAGVCPAGRSPISFGSAATLPSRVDRARFSPSTAASTIPRKRRSSVPSWAALTERMSNSMNTSFGIELTEVPPPVTLAAKVVLGSFGTSTL